MPQPARVVHIEDIEPFPGEVRWHPLRRELGVNAFGVNAFSAVSPGERVIEEHDEVSGGAAGHDELYVVIAGRARFTVDGEDVDAPAGTLIQVGRESKRGAIAAEPGTTVLVVGAVPGEVYEPSPWEMSAQAALYASRGDTQRSREAIAEALAGHPDDPHALYNVACAEALLGDRDAALGHLARVAELEPEKYRRWSEQDRDLDSLRDDPRFPAP
jgi:quercetin dioxygenase-like cupin family protein